MEDLLWYTHTQTLPSAFSLLPARMTSLQAAAQILAIGLQESTFAHRVQVPKDHAHGLWQFEKEGGVKEVLTHAVTMPIILPICDLLLVAPTSDAVWKAIVHNDVLACCFARCLLYLDPRTMPFPDQIEKGWDIYEKRWRPGTPHRMEWNFNFTKAWELVDADR